MLNRNGYSRAAKVIGLLIVNLAFIFYTSVLPKEVGIYLYYFPLIAVASVVFESTEKKLRYFFILLPFASLVLLFSMNFQVFGDYRMVETSYTWLFFAVNSISSGIIMILCINFMLSLNEETEKELHQLALLITGKNLDLEKANAELDRFLYSASHDLRSPLSSIKGLINVARYDTSDQKIHGYFNMMTDRVNRLEFFIKDIIDYSKNAKTAVTAEPVDFHSILNEVTDDIRFIEGASAIDFKNTVEIDHPVSVDKTRLSIILNNLLANAVKYHDLRKETKWINVRVSNSNGTVKVAVSDNGSGIAAEHQQKIFDMFYRGTIQSNGSGLGLYIVKEAVEKMNGTISVESQPGVGSSFLVTIPVS
jgi:signal transduction histidine kinase